MPARILLVDDEQQFRELTRDALHRAGDYELVEAASGAEALAKASDKSFDLILLDWRLPDTDGLDVLGRLRRLHPAVGIVVVTGYAETDLFNKAKAAGADDFLDKSPHFFEMLPVRVAKVLKDQREKAYLRREVEGRYQPDNIIGQSPPMREIFKLIAKVAPTSATVLIQGESGTGKELVARAIHFTSPRARCVFVAVNCAAIAEDLVESELFGIMDRTATGVSEREGKFEQANGGTVFLDEIGDMSPALQAKVLRVLQERSFERVGGRKAVDVDVRVIAATNKDLQKEHAAGRFREDLFYRLNVVSLVLPPLRERGDDVMLLAKHFIEESNADVKKNIRGLTGAATEMLRKYSFPGNIRQLSSIIERAIILADDQAELIDVEDLPPEVRFGAPASGEQQYGQLTHEDAKTAFEKQYLVALLKRAGSNVSEAARLADLNRSSLQEKLAKYGISPH